MMPARVMTTSWDDGDPRDARVAELLAKYGLAGTFYVPRKAPNRVMSDDEIRSIASGFEIGAHTLTHPRLTRLELTQAREEIAGSKDWVEQVTSATCTMFCPPEGKFVAEHRAMAADAGYAGFRTVELLSMKRPQADGRLAVMPTSVQAHSHPRAGYLRNALRRRSLSAIATFARAGFTADWATLARRLLRRVHRHGGVFHLWGHSWEIDEHGQWAALEDVLRAMGEHTAALTPMTNGQLVAASGG